jgi:hypothetical protein
VSLVGQLAADNGFMSAVHAFETQQPLPVSSKRHRVDQLRPTGAAEVDQTRRIGGARGSWLHVSRAHEQHTQPRLGSAYGTGRRAPGPRDLLAPPPRHVGPAPSQALPDPGDSHTGARRDKRRPRPVRHRMRSSHFLDRERAEHEHQQEVHQPQLLDRQHAPRPAEQRPPGRDPADPREQADSREDRQREGDVD